MFLTNDAKEVSSIVVFSKMIDLAQEIGLDISSHEYNQEELLEAIKGKMVENETRAFSIVRRCHFNGIGKEAVISTLKTIGMRSPRWLSSTQKRKVWELIKTLYG